MEIKEILATFDRHVQDVDRLVTFDKGVMQVAIDGVKELHNGLKDKHLDARHNGGRLLKMLEDIRDHQSLKPRYKLILNQAIVLLVSYFASAPRCQDSCRLG